jgi:hypothetical protein
VPVWVGPIEEPVDLGGGEVILRKHIKQYLYIPGWRGREVDKDKCRCRIYNAQLGTYRQCSRKPVDRIAFVPVCWQHARVIRREQGE